MNHIRISLISIILILVFNTILSAQTKSYSLNLKPFIGLNSGTTEYVMKMEDVFTQYIKSQLEFPLDQTIVGGEVELIFMPGTQQQWAINFGYYTNIFDPTGKMFDHDWWNIRTGLDEKISYTESDVEGKNSILLVEIDKLIIIGKKGSISLSGGFRQQNIDQEIYGFDGWWLDENGIKHDVSDPDINGLSYEIIYNLPNVGFRINYFLNQELTFKTRMAYTRAIISDFDDHILRFKTTKSNLTGNGLIADFAIRMDLGPTPIKGLFVELDGNLTYINGVGSSTQSWYGDDPAGEGDETGQVFTDIPHEINTTQFRFGIVVGLGL